MWKYIMGLSILMWIAACTGLPSSQDIHPTNVPEKIGIILSSQVQYVPYPPEVLALPSAQALIMQCENMGGEHCREITKPANSRTEFYQGQDKVLYAFVGLGGIKPEQNLKVFFRLFDPNNNMTAQLSVPVIHIPADFKQQHTYTLNFHYAPPDPTAWSLGKWRLEITINDHVINRTFQVVSRKV